MIRLPNEFHKWVSWVGETLLSAIDYDIGQMSLQFHAEYSITPYLGNLGTRSFLTGSMYILLPGRKPVVKFLIFLCKKLTFNSNIRSGRTHKTLITKCNPRCVVINKLMKNSLEFREESRGKNWPVLTLSSMKCLSLSE